MSSPAGDGLASEANASPEAVVGLYDTWAGSGEYDRDVEEWGYEAPERVAEMVADLVSAGDAVLDAGCGTGRVGTALAAVGVTGVIGGDFSPASVAEAEALGAYSEVHHLDLNGPLAYADEQFDVTVSVGVFSYLADTAATIDELLRIVRPAGAVIFTQRTDLWAERDGDALISALVDSGRCDVVVSDVSPYLPGHPDFGDTIGIRYVTLNKR